MQVDKPQQKISQPQVKRKNTPSFPESFSNIHVNKNIIGIIEKEELT